MTSKYQCSRRLLLMIPLFLLFLYFIISLIFDGNVKLALVTYQMKTLKGEDDSHIIDGPPEMLNFRDQFFAPILESFKQQARKTYAKTEKPRFRSGHIPKAYVYGVGGGSWYLAHFKDILDGNCPLPCNVTTNISQISSSDAVLFRVKTIKSRENLLKEMGSRDLSQPWIALETETYLKINMKSGFNYRTLNGIFNRTMHHRFDSDIVIPHGFIVRRGPEAAILPPTWRRPPVMHMTNNSVKKVVAAFISNCRDNSYRLQYVHALQAYIDVDVYGRCGTFECGMSRYAGHFYRSDTDPCMKMCSENYLFWLAFENALCTDYATEKLYNLLYYPVVPVVRGGANYTAIMPPHSYIDASDYTPKELAAKLQYLASTPQEYQKYLEWRHYFQPSTVGGGKTFCDLCVRLHDPKFYEYNVYEDFHDWLVEKANCNRSGTAVNYPLKPKI